MMQANLFQVSPESSPTPDCSLAGQQSVASLKERGMEIAARNRSITLYMARQRVREMAMRRSDRTATADDAGDYRLGNAAGSLFRGGDWEFTGQWTKSVRPQAHANDLRIWRLR